MRPREVSDILAEVMRGTVIESRHYGSLAIVDGAGNTVATAGIPELVTFLRSSAKPFQALPLIISGAADRFGFVDEEIAIACGSHNGEPIHTSTVQRMLNKLDLPPTALHCGVHEPFSKSVADVQRRAGIDATVLQNNCSGKHAGMLAVAKHLGEPLDLYTSPEHELQKDIRAVMGQFAGLTIDKIPIAVDGCSVPTFALPVTAMALAFARFVSRAGGVESGVAEACKRIGRAMTRYPEMVAGNGQFDTELMRVGQGRIISKSGAEGIWCAAIEPSDRWPSGLGIAVKIEDGSPRARSVIAMEILRQLNLLSDDERETLRSFTIEPIKNRRGEIVGEIKPTVKLGGNL